MSYQQQAYGLFICISRFFAHMLAKFLVLVSVTVLVLVLVLFSTASQAFTAALEESEDNHLQQINREFEFAIDVESQYMAQGRNQLDNGGIIWTEAQLQQEALTLSLALGRGVIEDYTELNFGVGFDIPMPPQFELSIGLQFIQVYGTERDRDTELVSQWVYTASQWFTPSIDYTYSLQAGGHFVEVSIHSNSWWLTGETSLSIYGTQAVDFGFAIDDYSGPSHFQLGLEAMHVINDRLQVQGHLNHITPQKGLKSDEMNQGKQVYAGLRISWLY